MKTFLFYDIETSGLNTAFDQILSFACIRTDTQLRELDRCSVNVKLRPDIVPSPGAFTTNRLSREDVMSGVSEYEAAVQIHRLFNTPGTVSIGYNNLGFDDEFLRFTFYRNLLEPYTHQYKNGCSRTDLLPVTALYFVFKPEALTWPLNGERYTLKLDRLSQTNNLVPKGRPHEAMYDVEATLEMATIFSKEKRIWEYALDFFNKKKDQERIKSFDMHYRVAGEAYRLGILLSPLFGSDTNFMVPAVNIGPSLKYSNQTLWLRTDHDDLLSFSSSPESSDFLAVRKRYGDIPVVLPQLQRFADKISDNAMSAANRNLEKISETPRDFFQIVRYHKAFEYPDIEGIDPDAALYQEGFFSKREKRDIIEFHKRDIDDKADFIDRMSTNRLKILASRIINRSGKDFSHHGIEDFDDYVDRVKLSLPEPVIGFRNDVKLSQKEALDELDKISKDQIDREQQRVLEWLSSYIQQM